MPRLGDVPKSALRRFANPRAIFACRRSTIGESASASVTASTMMPSGRANSHTIASTPNPSAMPAAIGSVVSQRKREPREVRVCTVTSGYTA